MLSTSSTIKSPSPFWLTLRQANEAGGHMRKGEQSQIVVFWKVDRVADDTVIELDAEAIESELGRRRFVLRYFRVWNLEQCELPSVVVDLLPEIETHQHDAIDAAEGIIAGMPNALEIQYEGTKAFYSPVPDRITRPCRELFVSAAELYATAFHEICHATCHPNVSIAVRCLRLRRLAHPLTPPKS